MEYLIVFGVLAMMSLYVWIIARCFREPEWR
jgi:preprotein translocase subunit SecE